MAQWFFSSIEMHFFYFFCQKPLFFGLFLMGKYRREREEDKRTKEKTKAKVREKLSENDAKRFPQHEKWKREEFRPKKTMH